jgi:signal recognition particle subunit SRP54
MYIPDPGDSRGGAALSMRMVTGQPIKFAGMGEKLDALEEFHPERIASRILGMGDIVSLVEKAAENFNQQDAEAMMAKMQSGKFDLNDLRAQLKQLQKLGGLSSIMGFIPGLAKIKNQMSAAQMDDNVIKRQEAIILSMTPQERRNPDLIKASRKKRIASGCGMRVEDVNKLLKNFEDMRKVMQQAKKMGPANFAKRLPPGFAPKF